MASGKKSAEKLKSKKEELKTCGELLERTEKRRKELLQHLGADLSTKESSEVAKELSDVSKAMLQLEKTRRTLYKKLGAS